jgi:hypothetical protein
MSSATPTGDRPLRVRRKLAQVMPLGGVSHGVMATLREDHALVKESLQPTQQVHSHSR